MIVVHAHAHASARRTAVTSPRRRNFWGIPAPCTPPGSSDTPAQRSLRNRMATWSMFHSPWTCANGRDTSSPACARCSRFARLVTSGDCEPVMTSATLASGLDAGVADLLEELNSWIEDDDFKIGPSYFTRPAVHAQGGLERAWRTAILPLLEEHHYGDGTDVPGR